MLSNIDNTLKKQSKKKAWAWFFGLYFASLAVIGGLYALMHGLLTIIS